MKFCPVVPEICRGQVHGARKERRIRIRIIIIIIRNGAKTISLQTLFGRLNDHKSLYIHVTSICFNLNMSYPAIKWSWGLKNRLNKFLCYLVTNITKFYWYLIHVDYGNSIGADVLENILQNDKNNACFCPF